MAGESERPRRIKVQDRRRVHSTEPSLDERDQTDVPTDAEASVPLDAAPRPEERPEVLEAAEASAVATDDAAGQPDYLDDLRRLQAEFDNYRKRMMREQTALTSRAAERVVEGLLPVLDNFERALAHAGELEGLDLVYKQLRDVLAQEGLEEVPAEGVAFDPALHEAVELSDDPNVEEPTCTSVFRRGYRIGSKLLRPAMVTVARPPEDATAEDEQRREEPAAAGEG